MNAEEARTEAYGRARSAIIKGIYCATQLGHTRVARRIEDRHFRADIVHELVTDGYRVTAGEYDGDIIIDWSTP